MLESLSRDDLLRLCLEASDGGFSTNIMRAKDRSVGALFHIATDNSCWFVEVVNPKKGLLKKVHCSSEFSSRVEVKTCVAKELEVGNRAIRAGFLEPIRAVVFMPKGREEGVSKE